MAVISAALVKQLRDQTSQSMMDCKKALMETEGDLEKAFDLLRKKGMAVMEKRGGRETREGRIVGKTAADGGAAVMVMLCSETDFTARNGDFVVALEKIAESLLGAESSPDTAEDLGDLPTAEGSKVSDLVNDLVSKTGEKITVGGFARYGLDGAGLLHSYVHFNNKIGTMLHLTTETTGQASAEAVKTLASDLAMHITAVNPLVICREDVSEEVLAKEREVASAQVTNKPANIIDKIVEGKLNKWYKQHVLLEQPFVKDDSRTVQDLLTEIGKQVDGKITLKRFIRLQTG